MLCQGAGGEAEERTGLTRSPAARAGLCGAAVGRGLGASRHGRAEAPRTSGSPGHPAVPIPLLCAPWPHLPLGDRCHVTAPSLPPLLSRASARWAPGAGLAAPVGQQSPPSERHRNHAELLALSPARTGQPAASCPTTFPRFMLLSPTRTCSQESFSPGRSLGPHTQLRSAY